MNYAKIIFITTIAKTKIYLIIIKQSNNLKYEAGIYYRAGIIWHKKYSTRNLENKLYEHKNIF